MTVRGDDVHDFAGNAVLVGQRDAAEGMPHLLPKLALDHVARRVFIKLQRLAHICEKRTRDEVVALNGNAATKGLLKHIGDGGALPSAGIEMLNESHLN